MDEKLYSRVVDTMTEGVVVTDATATLIYVNDALCRLLGYTREELVGQSAKDFISPPLRAEFRQQLALRERGIAHPYETTIICRERHRGPGIDLSPGPLR